MILHTARLTLIPIEASAWPDFLSLRSNPAVRSHLGGALPESVAKRQFELARNSWMLDHPSLFAVRERQTGSFVGVTGPWSLFGSRDEEMLWELNPAFWGRGLAYEAAAAALDWLFLQAGRQEISFYIHPANARSVSLAGRLGAELDLRPRPASPLHRGSDIVFVLSRLDWLLRARPSSAQAARDDVDQTSHVA